MEILTNSTDARMKILADGAKYDVSCSSSNSSRSAKSGSLGACHIAGLCHSFTSDGRCVSLLKLLMTNKCEFDCLYCANRRSADVPRASMTPREICEIVDGFYRRNYIEGLFLSSAVEKSPDATMQRLVETVIMLRTEYNFRAYIHVKAIPGASPHLIALAAEYADRMSVNIELPTEISLNSLAPQKKKNMILSPMSQLAKIVRSNDENYRGISVSHTPQFSTDKNDKAVSLSHTPQFSIDENISRIPTQFPNAEKDKNINTPQFSADKNIPNISEFTNTKKDKDINISQFQIDKNIPNIPQSTNMNTDENSLIPHTPQLSTVDKNTIPQFSTAENNSKKIERSKYPQKKLPAGQTTQMIVGATEDSDGQILRLTEGLYRGYGLKRVYFSAYIPINENSRLPSLPPNLRRENRLYQADWLLRFYGFSADEIAPAGANLDLDLDPKLDWALKNIGKFPVEINTASYETLLRVPGIGVRNAYRITLARRHSTLTFDALKKMRVCLPKAVNFITAAGKFFGISDPAQIRAAATKSIISTAEKGIQTSIFDLLS
jgi:putative DNA modification/repair radical SAM protein